MGGPELDLIGGCIPGAALWAGGILPGPGGPPRPPIGPGAPPGGAEPGGLLQNCKAGAIVSLIFAMYTYMCSFLSIVTYLHEFSVAISSTIKLGTVLNKIPEKSGFHSHVPFTNDLDLGY
jgi:hypothetical protein